MSLPWWWRRSIVGILSIAIVVILVLSVTRRDVASVGRTSRRHHRILLLVRLRASMLATSSLVHWECILVVKVVGRRGNLAAISTSAASFISFIFFFLLLLPLGTMAVLMRYRRVGFCWGEGRFRVREGEEREIKGIEVDLSLVRRQVSSIESLKYCNSGHGILVGSDDSSVRSRHDAFCNVFVRVLVLLGWFFVLSHDGVGDEGFKDVVNVEEGSIEIRPSAVNHCLSQVCVDTLRVECECLREEFGSAIEVRARKVTKTTPRNIFRPYRFLLRSQPIGVLRSIKLWSMIQTKLVRDAEPV